MKVVKEILYEKFEETSDPVRDMHVGGIDLDQKYKETVGDGIRRWFVFLWDLQLIGKKVTVTEYSPHKEFPGTEKTFVITNVKRGSFPMDIFFIYDENGEEKKIKIDVHKKLYIHES